MCGIIGMASVVGQNVAREMCLGLYDLQHRGEQGAGIVLSSDEGHWTHKSSGLVTEVFREDIIEGAFGSFGVGHVRYSTIGDTALDEMSVNVQPLQGDFYGEPFWVAHNGNLVSLESIKKEAEQKGYRFRTTSDTEVIVALLSVSSKRDFLAALLEILPRLRGAFSLIILYKNKVIGVRDRFGIRPLCLGRNDQSFILASESCAFNTIQGHFLFDIQPGELIVLDEEGINSKIGNRPFIWAEKPELKICIFEFVYFARPDSVIDGKSVYSYRKQAGEFLAKDCPAEADIVIPVPDSGRYYDIGFARASGIPLEPGISRNRYFATRTFLTPRDVNRSSLQELKLRVLREVVQGKRVVAIEDSIIRANVAPKVVAMLRREGASEVHLRVGSSPVCFTCHLGIDMAAKEELIASSLPPKDIERYIQVDSLAYLSKERMIEASGFKRENLSMGCFTGEYAVLPEGS